MQYAIYDESSGLFFQGVKRSYSKQWGHTPKLFTTKGQARGYRNSYVKKGLIARVDIQVVETFPEE